MKINKRNILKVLCITIICNSFALNTGCSLNYQVSSSHTNHTETQARKFHVKDKICLNKSVNISFLSCDYFKSNNMFAQPKEDYVYIICKFEFENISSTDKLISGFDFSCYADNSSCNQEFLGDDLMSTYLSSGRKVSGNIYFEVPKKANNIEIEFYNRPIYEDKVIFVCK